MKFGRFVFVLLVIGFCFSVSAVRLPVVGSDNSTWGNYLNSYLVNLAGENGTSLNSTIVNAVNMNVSSVNSTHIVDGSIGSVDIENGTIVDADISDSTNLTLGQKITFALGEVIDNVVDGYIRLTGNLDMNNYNVTGVKMIDFDVSGCGDETTAGAICWNADDMTLDVVTGAGNVIQTGQEMTLLGKNVDSVALLNGQIVTLIGSSGDRGTVIRADASNSSLASRLGVITVESCGVNNPCPVTTFGKVRELDTSAWSPGTLLYLAADGSGNLTSTCPNFPNYRVLIGAVIRQHANEGVVLVNPQIDYTNHVTFDAIDLADHVYADGYINASRFASEGKWGVNDSGAACTITEITNGIITGATCSG